MTDQSEARERQSHRDPVSLQRLQQCWMSLSLHQIPSVNEQLITGAIILFDRVIMAKVTDFISLVQKWYRTIIGNFRFEIINTIHVITESHVCFRL